MKITIAFTLLLFFTFGKYTEHLSINIGETSNVPYIGRALSSSDEVVENQHATKTVVYPEGGPIYAKDVIKGFQFTEYCQDLPEIDIVSGGIGKKHIKLVISPKLGKATTSIILFYGDKTEDSYNQIYLNKE